MGVKIVFKDKAEKSGVPEKAAKGKVKFGNKTGAAPGVKEVDGFIVTGVIDLSGDEIKFLIHRHKKGVWYKVESYDEYGEKGTQLKLQSPHGAVFDSTLKITDVRFYALATTRDPSLIPTEKVMHYVQHMEPAQ